MTHARFFLPLLVLGWHPAAQAQVQQPVASAPATLQTRAADVVAFFKGDVAAEQIFSASFLAAVPPTQLTAVVTQTTAQFGPAIAVEKVTPTGPASATLSLRFEKAIISGPMTIDAAGKISNLLLNDIAAIDDSPAKILSDLQALPGVTNAWFGPLNGGEPMFVHNGAEPLALGSTFKLYVLSALSRSIAQGEHRWDEVVSLDTRSFPSGLTQDWPKDAPVTIQTLATLMIQISDNTATDRLIALLGRNRIEVELAASNSHASRNLPFLTTREVFLLKADAALRQSYSAADESTRRSILAGLASREASLQSVVSALGTAPVAIDSLEWFASPADLRALLRRLTGPEHATTRAIMAASPGMGDAARKDWPYVGFKGGSEAGVLNLTWLLRGRDDRWHMLTLGWNDPAAAVDQNKLIPLALRILALSDGSPAD